MKKGPTGQGPNLATLVAGSLWIATQPVSAVLVEDDAALEQPPATLRRLSQFHAPRHGISVPQLEYAIAEMGRLDFASAA